MLEAPPGLVTRPTSDRLRETLFNVLAPRIEGAHFLDLYAGSGAVGIEAVSRGAQTVVLVERAAPALKILRRNLESLNLRNKVRVEPVSVTVFLKKVRPESREFTFDVVFLDPPYDAENEYASTLNSLGGERSSLLNPSAIVIAEHRRQEKLDDSFGKLQRSRVLVQGDAALSFYSMPGIS